MTVTLLIIAAIAVGGPVLISLLVEALRPKPGEPVALSWAPDLPVQHADVDGVRLCYVKAGEGPPLVLLHTLRTQLDIFQKVIPELAENFTVYVPDYPGHGWSDIPAVDYTPAFFVGIVGRFLDQQRIRNATLAGVSIGGTIPAACSAPASRRRPRRRRQSL